MFFEILNKYFKYSTHTLAILYPYSRDCRLILLATETADLAITAAKPTKKSASLPLIPLLQKNSEGTRIAASPFTVMDTYSALWLINAIIVLRLKFKIQGLKHVLEGDVY